MMKVKTIGKLTLATGAAMLVSSAPAHAQFMGVFQAAMSVVNQATGKLGSKIMGADKPSDLEAERAKFFNAVETQTTGMDKASKAAFQAQLNNQWGSMENALLMRNAQLQHEKSAPLIDLKKVAQDAMGGMAVQMNISSITGGAGGIGDLMQGAAMNGIVSGVNGQPQGANQYARPVYHNGTMADAVTGGLTNGAGTAVSGAVSGAVKSAVDNVGGVFGNSTSGDYEITEGNDPAVFFGKAPAELSAKDLYRENGNLGWKRLDGSVAGAEAYAPIAGDEVAKAAVFNFDPATGQLKAAFRVLKATQVDFKKVVDAVSKKYQAQPRFASQGSVLRAVWENGMFVAADSTKVSAGWSSLVNSTYQKATPAVAMN
ncbi:hypothetical protein [Caballeronia sp. LZ001]|nr:hypothetical protein [Caballeronia sp. LZ001]MDR5798987.1 hypothetical protein [Caballeronia sp. LZ001]